MAYNLTRNPGESDAEWEARKKAAADAEAANPSGGGLGENATQSRGLTSAEEGRYGTPKEPIGYDAVRSRQQSDKLISAYENYQDRTAPKAGAPGATPVVGAATTAAAPTKVGTAAQSGPVTVAPAVGAKAAVVNAGQSDEQRNAALALQSRLQAQADGTGGPSAAELQMRLGNAQAAAAQSSLAAGHKGYSTAALRAAMRNTAALQQTNNAQTGILRAQEQAQGRQELAGVIQGTRAADIDVAKANAGFSQETGLNYAQAQNRMAELQAQITQAGGQFNAAQQNELAKLQAQLDAGNAQFNAGQRNETARFNAGEANKGATTDSEVRLRTELANLDAQLKAQGMNDEQRRAYLQAYLVNQGQVLQSDAAYASRVAGDNITGKDVLGATASGGTTLGAAAITASDRRGKTDIKPESDADVADFLSKLEAYSYRYKDPEAPGASPGEHVGPMAQELERSKIGRTVVTTGPDGMKAVDTERLTMALAGALARVARAAKLTKGAR